METPGCVGSSAPKSSQPQLNPHMLLSQEDLTLTSSMKEEVIHHREHKSPSLTSPAHSSRPELFTLSPCYPLCNCRIHGWYTGQSHFVSNLKSLGAVSAIRWNRITNVFPKNTFLTALPNIFGWNILFWWHSWPSSKRSMVICLSSGMNTYLGGFRKWLMLLVFKQTWAPITKHTGCWLSSIRGYICTFHMGCLFSLFYSLLLNSNH